MNLISPFFLVHGLAHAIAGRMRRAAALLGAECVGVICLALGLYYFGENASVAAFPQEISTIFEYVYLALGACLFLASFVWDVSAVVYESMLQASRRRRRTLLYSAMAANRWGAEYLLERASTGSEDDARWAKRLVDRTAGVMPLAHLIEALKRHSRRPGYLLRSLKRRKRHDEVEAIAAEWREAKPALRRWIVDVLAAKPNEASLDRLRSLRQDNWYGRLRYSLGLWHYRFKMWPKCCCSLDCWQFRWRSLRCFESHATKNDPARPLLRVMQNSRLLSQLPERDFVATVHFLAEAHSAKSADTLLRLFADAGTNSNPVRTQEVARGLGLAICNDALDEARRSKLLSALSGGLKQGRQAVRYGLQKVSESRDRCGISDSSRRELVQEATILLKDDPGREEASLAIAGLDAAGHVDAVTPLRAFVLDLTQAKNKDQGQKKKMPSVGRWDELRRDALAALKWNGLRNPAPCWWRSRRAGPGL